MLLLSEPQLYQENSGWILALILLAFFAIIITVLFLTVKGHEKVFNEMKVGDIVDYKGVDAEILEKHGRSVTIKVRVSGLSVSKKQINASI